MAQAAASVAGRRSTKVIRKPKVAPAPAVAQMSPAPVNEADALAAYRNHLKTCRASNVVGRCDGTHRCGDGTRLAALYDRLRRTQPRRDRERAQEARVEEMLARVRSAKASRAAAREWEERRTDAPRQALAKRSGTEVEEANNTRRIPVPGAVSHLRGAGVPLKTLHPAC
ncbi:hypothetical protein EYS09_07935 [Streptomyces kasugaensis]|uniref:Uncharacterized protein n=1 Tax=Streptomyces kasugaensis TaxID=1946 RepID=A0A4Q9I010_STRKA|nr:hypothetical protein [Streptomyces kasugaensis]TBO60219.1 hypothetical protein EYS09_07935 [Streptomyces kasugaensis]